MSKVTSFRMNEERLDELDRLVNFYTNAQLLDGFLPGKKFSKTEILEFLIAKEFKSLQEQDFEV